MIQKLNNDADFVRELGEIVFQCDRQSWYKATIAKGEQPLTLIPILVGSSTFLLGPFFLIKKWLGLEFQQPPMKDPFFYACFSIWLIVFWSLVVGIYRKCRSPVVCTLHERGIRFGKFAYPFTDISEIRFRFAVREIDKHMPTLGRLFISLNRKGAYLDEHIRNTSATIWDNDKNTYMLKYLFADFTDKSTKTFTEELFRVMSAFITEK